MKKLFVLLLSVLLAFSLFACNTTPKQELTNQEKIAEGSQTTYTAKLTGMLGALFTGHPEVAAGIAAGDVGLSKIFTTDIGRKWLTEGLGKTFPSELQTAAGSALRIGTQSIGNAILPKSQ